MVLESEVDHYSQKTLLSSAISSSAISSTSIYAMVVAIAMTNCDDTVGSGRTLIADQNLELKAPCSFTIEKRSL